MLECFGTAWNLVNLMQVGGCRVSAAWHSFWAQLLTFLSGDKSPLCELPLCGEHGFSSLKLGVCGPLPIPRLPQQLSLGRRPGSL